MSWRDGSPTASSTGDDGYIWANNALGAGFSFTVPADTTSRTLYVYVGGYSSGATITAHLSDGSAADFVASASGSAHYAQLYTITYHAGSAGKTLMVTYTKSQTIGGAGGSVDLIAAALVQAPAATRSPSPPPPPKVPVVLMPVTAPINVSTIDPAAVGTNSLSVLGHENALTMAMFG